MASARRPRVYVADGHPMFLEAVVGAIGKRPDLELVGSAGTGADAVAGIRELGPDVAVLEMRLRGLSGPEVLGMVAADGARTRVLFLSADIESALVFRALAGGAAGYLSKELGGEAICDAILMVARGELVLSPQVRQRLADAIRERDGQGRRGLTARELAVLALAAEGFSTLEIAARASVASATVKADLQSVYTKLDVPDRTSAVAAAIRRGLLT